MKNRLILTLVILLAAAAAAYAQNEKPMKEKDEVEVYAANTDDVRSIDAIIKATYDVISGDAGVTRDWDRFRSLFYKDARLIPSGKNAETGVVGATAISPEGYMSRSRNFLETNGFHEQEIARRTETFGNIAHVFSTYEGRRSLTDEKPFLRGINSFQLLNDGKRWWVMTIFWQAESPDNPLPEKYFKTVD